ncbi:kinesin-like protein [Dunaliella salina]|uniref:Kinesin-like protein n=1 Tax=Dunaliella salina TaxID=3046 RepID=A0ABQ7H4R0_DUNSA|nr:kinesin-like protein [Dunaliella salina]|eukprot:KAF5841849.1 kinesin-like protein [Dunaliella salina]
MVAKKTHVKVFIRTRPTASNFDGLKVDEDGCSVHVKLPKESGQVLGPNNAQDSYSFKFDGVLENATQDTMYTTAAHEVVDSLLAGYSGCVLAYGQTAAGKTFTMAGDLHNYVHRGIIPRSIHHTFQEIDMRVDKLYKVHVSYLEIYNEQLYDLLAENPGDSNGMAVQEDPTRGAYVRGLTLVEVKSEEEALAQYFLGEQVPHDLLLCTLCEHYTPTPQGVGTLTPFDRLLGSWALGLTSKLLLGGALKPITVHEAESSRRASKKPDFSQTLREAQSINKSLSFLEQTVTALARKEAHVPFRQSRLTSVLRDALGGNCKTVMVANIWGEPQHLEETLSTLRFASRVRTLTTELSLAESSDPALLLRRYERQIKELKQELAMRDALSGKARVNYDDLSDIEIREMNQLAKDFLQGRAEVDQLPTESIKRIKECYKQMRAVYSAAGAELQQQLESAEASLQRNGAQPRMSGSVPGTPGQNNRVGEVAEGERGFQVGTAPQEARPASMSVAGGLGSPPRAPASVVSKVPASVSGTLLQDESNSPKARDTSPGAFDDLAEAHGGVDRNAAFVHFKRDTAQGQSLAAAVKERSQQHKELMASVRDLGASVNAAKARIDELNATLGNKKTETPVQATDSEHSHLLQDLKAGKMHYRTTFDNFKEQRTTLDALAASLAEAKKALIVEFDKWLATASPLSKFTSAKGKADEDELDAAEAFERMQLTALSAADPDSAAYHAARKHTSMLRMSGNFKGSKAAAVNARRKEQELLINAGLKQ